MIMTGMNSNPSERARVDDSSGKQPQKDRKGMPEFRKDAVTGQWVIIARERAKRPFAFNMTRQPPQEGPCPFCRSEERQTPSEVLAYRPPGSMRDAPDWWLRVVPNKYPALVAHEPVRRAGNGMYDMINGMGIHEVVIETPRHDAHIATMTTHEVEEIIWAYRDRTVEMCKDPRLEYVMIFKNHRAEAGASLDHPHSQIIATPIIPKRVEEELNGAQRYFEYKERCVFCDMIAQEIKDNERIVFESDLFISFMPYASRFPFECCILPKEHASFFHDIQRTRSRISPRSCTRHPASEEHSQRSPVQLDASHDTAAQQREPLLSLAHGDYPELTRPAGFRVGYGFLYQSVCTRGRCTRLVAGAAAVETVRERGDPGRSSRESPGAPEPPGCCATGDGIAMERATTPACTQLHSPREAIEERQPLGILWNFGLLVSVDARIPVLTGVPTAIRGADSCRPEASAPG